MLLLIVWRGFAESSDRAVYCSSSQYAFVSWDCGLVRSNCRRQDLGDNRWESLSKETLPCHPQDVIQHLVHKRRVVICIIFLFFYLNTGKQTVVFSQWVIRTELLNNTTIVHGTVSSELSWKGVHRLSSVCIRELFDTRAQEWTESNFPFFFPGFLFVNWTFNFLNRVEVNLLWNFDVNLQCRTVWLKKRHWLWFCWLRLNWNWHKFVVFVLFIFFHLFHSDLIELVIESLLL